MSKSNDNLNQTTLDEDSSSSVQQKKHNKWIIGFVIVAILAIIGIAAAIYFFIQSQNKTECEPTITYTKTESAATNTGPTKIESLAAEKLISRFIDYDYYESNGRTAVLKALSGVIHNEDYMVFVAVKNDFFNLADVQSWKNGNVIDNEGVLIYRDKLQSSVRSFFGNDVSISKNEFSLGCDINLRTHLRRSEVYEFYKVGCGGTGHGGDIFFIDNMTQSDSTLTIDIVFADYVSGPNVDGSAYWELNKNNNGETVKVVELQDSSEQAINQYLHEHPNDFNKYRLVFTITGDNLILSGITSLN